MTLTTLFGYIGFAALILTYIMYAGLKNVRNPLMSFLQNFTGILFVFSGWVKAIDPLGTAFKMQQYFDQFEVVFSGTAIKFISPVFPLLSSYAGTFSVVMIIFEIVLGLMLIAGASPKFTAWAFFLMVAFFTVLTGFTYLTGYVPEGVNFFSFGDWGEYQTKNMKVTDCGCFGDFIKLEPKISFFKDVFLLFPAIYFIRSWKNMHKWFTATTHNIMIIVSVIVLLLYCFNNFYWNEPHIDFRPFKNGADIRGVRKAEADAAAAVQVTGFKLRNKKSGETITLDYAVYMKEFSKYPSDSWETIEQIKTEPAVKPTKVSEFFINTYDGQDITEEFLQDTGVQLAILSYKPLYHGIDTKISVAEDSVFISDTIKEKNGKISIVKRFKEMNKREVKEENLQWDKAYLAAYADVIKPFTDAAMKDGVVLKVVTAGLDASKAEDLAQATGIQATYLTADDILLKTVMRSNPGIILWKNGVILQKWHYKKLPAWDQVRQQFLK